MQAAKDAQWSLLCNKFNAANTVLLFHLTNHYVLVFGGGYAAGPVSLRPPSSPPAAGQCASSWTWTRGMWSATYSPLARVKVHTRRPTTGALSHSDPLPPLCAAEPKSWLSWDQCRHELLKWQGYSMLCFERRD